MLFDFILVVEYFDIDGIRQENKVIFFCVCCKREVGMFGKWRKVVDCLGDNGRLISFCSS